VVIMAGCCWRMCAALALVCLLTQGGAAKPRKFSSEQARRDEAMRLFDLAQAYGQKGMLKESADTLEEVALIAEDNPDAQNHAGMAHLQAGNLADAKKRWRKCVELEPNHATARFNLATVTAELGDLHEATAMMEGIVRDVPEADNFKTLAILLFKQDLHEASIRNFERCVQARPDHADCYCGMGNSLIKIGRDSEALAAYDEAVKVNPNEPGYLNNVGNLLVRHHRFNTTAQKYAIEVLSRAIALDGTYADGYFNLGEALSAVSLHSDAVDKIRAAMALDPSRIDYRCTLNLDLRKLCDWAEFDQYSRDLDAMWRNGVPPEMARTSKAVSTRKPGEAKSRVRDKEPSLCPNPLDALSYPLSLPSILNIASAHGEVSRRFVAQSAGAGALGALGGAQLGPTGRIRVGYVSIELRDRPVGKDMVHALSTLPRERVEIKCFSLNPSPREGVQGGDTLMWHRKMVDACDGNFFDVSGVSYSAAAARINEERPNILINLDGWTSAPLINEIFILQASPIQLNFKGFAGTLGIPEVHGLVSDRVVTPPEYQTFYTERFVMMPGSYHYNGHDHLYPQVHTGGMKLPPLREVAGGKFSMHQAARPTELLSGRGGAGVQLQPVLQVCARVLGCVDGTAQGSPQHAPVVSELECRWERLAVAARGIEPRTSRSIRVYDFLS